MRSSATCGPVCRIALPRTATTAAGAVQAAAAALAAPWVDSLHLDSGAAGWPGHLLLSSADGAVHLYDVRRVHQQDAAGEARPIETLTSARAPLGAACGARRGGGSWCFTVDDQGRRMVTGGGPSVRLYDAQSGSAGGTLDALDARAGSGSGRYSWRRRFAEEVEAATGCGDDRPGLQDEDDGSSAVPSNATPRKKEKKGRQTKKQWSHDRGWMRA